ncbi:YdcF family protein [Leptospira sp. 2 VSF19]|uniref:YdcF family protein n=1 Tax=Leptospira soteropolitanensis TaxID=2950025 RepID=A0AAW5VGG6_9LEPT|nr:YdcF family protein [Leptospira soteropolitanensis]MCW7491592.1 YdcF family protein [Leptospira soteropolitanensis]MCW7499176.1 YdcF family protein [Leptospira soteropolitanensis]MCW7521232.1 YdcF family protein [Leptospira soteropolitanensis]MCW7525280.1 YdcF family protein [Leptospira soteropolitanensis]MCW7529147.1 YdcF family protein [Leptospira soteropolitanensis]
MSIKQVKVKLILLTKIFSFYLLISVGFILYNGLIEEKDLKSSFALVLGNKVELNGKPSDRLQARLDRAITLYKENLIQKIIVSGGIGKEGFDEARVMKEYLVAQGIETDHIVEDNLGYTTERSADNLKEILKSNFAEPILIISQYYHLPRAAFLVKKVGFLNVKTSYARYFEFRDFYSIFRETVALPYVIVINSIFKH